MTEDELKLAVQKLRNVINEIASALWPETPPIPLPPSPNGAKVPAPAKPKLIGPRLRTARMSCRLSQADLAARVGVSQTAISQFERRQPCPDWLIPQLAKALQVPPQQLTGES